MVTNNNFQDLEFIRLQATKEGILASAKYQGWHHKYNFLIQPDGKVKGKASSGYWLELSGEFGAFILARVQSLLIDRSDLVYG